ncbi:MAG: terpene cyclase/mutase family protein [Flavobacteriales bacterium]|nr:terpene cyclase/mutase family protein [Flavobacteriales bacterium]
MIRSLLIYSGNFLLTPFHRDARKIVGRDVFASLVPNEFNSEERSLAIEGCVEWLLSAQDHMKDGGFGSYHLIEGWTTSYPETSGYIIPSLLDYAKLYNRPDIVERCGKCADWLVKIQKPSGGWQSMTIDHQRPEVVFNTGQVIRGLYAMYLESGNKKYLEACERAIDWLCQIQEEDGAWRKHAFMNVERVYDSYVDAPILDVNVSSNNTNYRDKAVKNLEWIISKRQLENGWFQDCDNTLHKTDRPILHTISYTIDGLLDSARMTNDQKYFEAALKPAAKLLSIFNETGQLHGRYDQNWRGSEHVILTGCAQISICWMKIYQINKDNQFLEGASKMINVLISTQQRTNSGSDQVKGALSGSYPIWGRYEKFSFPNWATKYFLDALLLEQQIKS